MFYIKLSVVRVTIAAIKHHDQKQVGVERVHLAFSSTALYVIKVNQARDSNRVGTLSQELLQRPRRSAAYCLTLHGLLGLLCYKTQDRQPGGNFTHSGLGPLSAIIRRMPCRLAYSLINIGISLVEVPSSPVTLACVQLT